MSLFLLAVDLNWLVQFIFTLLVVAVGILHLVKSSASNYFLAEDSDRDNDAVSDWPAASSPPPISGADPPEEMTTVEEESCAVCGCRTKKFCSGCKIVSYCSEACQRSHWNSDHKKECKTFKINGKSSRGTKRGCGSLITASSSSKSLHQLTKILFPYEVFVELFNWDKPGFPPCGLINCGNSCFANAVLQCLTYTRPLIAYLLERGHRRECRRNDWCFLCEFQTHVERAQSLNPFSPINILSRLPHIGGNLGYGKQEDAHEFMRFAIDTMQSVCLDEYGGEKAVHPSAQETTFIQHIFGGHLQSQVLCTKCNNVSNQCENMMDLTVEIQGDAASLEDCLDQFTAKECLHGDNMYKCDGCNDYVLAWKRLTVRQAPNILTIALKRFQSGRFGKLNKRVTFPETLDLSPYMSDTAEDDNIYKLYAVIVHVDMLNASFFGHYICYIKDFCGKWYRVDDCKVTRVDSDEVLSQGAYMLLYSRISARRSSLYPVETQTEEKHENMDVEKEVELSSTQHVQGLSSGEHAGVEDPSKVGVLEVELSSTSNSEDGKEDVEMVDFKENCAVSLDDELCEVPLSVAIKDAAVPLEHTHDHATMAISGTIEQLTEADASKMMMPSFSLSNTQDDSRASNIIPQDLSSTYTSDQDSMACQDPVLDNDSMAMQNKADAVELLPQGNSSSEIMQEVRSAGCSDTSGDIGRQFSDRIQASMACQDPVLDNDPMAMQNKADAVELLPQGNSSSEIMEEARSAGCSDTSGDIGRQFSDRIQASMACQDPVLDNDSMTMKNKADAVELLPQGNSSSEIMEEVRSAGCYTSGDIGRQFSDRIQASENSVAGKDSDAKTKPLIRPGFLKKYSVASQKAVDANKELCCDVSIASSSSCEVLEINNTESLDKTEKAASGLLSSQGVQLSNGFGGAARKPVDECLARGMHTELSPGFSETNSLATQNHLNVSVSASGSNKVFEETKTACSGDVTVENAGKIPSAGGIAHSNGFQDGKSVKKRSAKPLIHRGFLDKHR